MDSALSMIFMAVIAISVLIFIIRIFTKPIRFIFKLLLNTLFGFIILFVVNFLGAFVGFGISMTALNALIVGFLGVPGVLLVILFSL